MVGFVALAVISVDAGYFQLLKSLYLNMVFAVYLYFVLRTWGFDFYLLGEKKFKFVSKVI